MRKGKPVEPVVVSEYGETISGYPNQEGNTEHTEDTVLSTLVHDDCATRGITSSSWADTYQISKSHDAIVCRGCRRSWVFPNTVKTYGDLRRYFAKYNHSTNQSSVPLSGGVGPFV